MRRTVVVDVGEARVDIRKTTLVSRHAVTERFPDWRKRHSLLWRSAAEWPFACVRIIILSLALHCNVDVHVCIVHADLNIHHMYM